VLLTSIGALTYQAITFIRLGVISSLLV
jgi:hypothetical protein